MCHIHHIVRTRGEDTTDQQVFFRLSIHALVLKI